MANKWLQHLARFRQQNTHLNAREMMTAARKTYQGGAAAAGSYVASVSGSSVNSNTRNVSNTESQFAAVGGRSTRRRSSRSRRRRGGCGSGYNTNSNPSSLEGGRRRTSRKSRRRRR
jgi:hypothetical protein